MKVVAQVTTGLCIVSAVAMRSVVTDGEYLFHASLNCFGSGWVTRWEWLVETLVVFIVVYVFLL